MKQENTRREIMLKVTAIKEGDKLYDYCLRCGRKLKSPKAKILGYGIICYNKTHKNREKFKKLF